MELNARLPARQLAEKEPALVISRRWRPQHTPLQWVTSNRRFGFPARHKVNQKRKMPVQSRHSRAYFTAVEIDANVVLRLVPTPFRTVMSANAMPAAMRPYSMAVVPDSSLRKAANPGASYDPLCRFRGQASALSSKLRHVY